MIQIGQWCAFFCQKAGYRPFSHFPRSQSSSSPCHQMPPHAAARCFEVLWAVASAVVHSLTFSICPALPCIACHFMKAAWWNVDSRGTSGATIVSQHVTVPQCPTCISSSMWYLYVYIYMYIVSHMKSRDFKIFNFSWMAVSLFIFGHRNEMTIPHDSYFWEGWHKHQQVSTKKRFWINLIPLK